jgi:predicted membrane protein
MKKGTWLIIAGCLIFLILLLSYFIKTQVTRDYNSAVSIQISTPLLGILIFHSPVILAAYVAISLIFIFIGLSLNRKRGL